jgi:hypothetical protein
MSILFSIPGLEISPDMHISLFKADLKSVVNNYQKYVLSDNWYRCINPRRDSSNLAMDEKILQDKLFSFGAIPKDIGVYLYFSLDGKNVSNILKYISISIKYTCVLLDVGIPISDTINLLSNFKSKLIN